MICFLREIVKSKSTFTLNNGRLIISRIISQTQDDSRLTKIRTRYLESLTDSGGENKIKISIFLNDQRR